MEREEVYYMLFIKTRADVDDLKHYSVSDNESFCWEEFGTMFKFVDFVLAPQPFKFINFVVLMEARGRFYFHVVPDGFEFITGAPEVADDPGDDGSDFPVFIVHLVAHVEGFEEHESEKHAEVAL